MGGKAKPTKHTAREIAKKTQLATQNAGGGGAGLKDRLGGGGGESKYCCSMCGQAAPDLKTMQVHFEARHPKEVFDPEKCENLHEKFGGTTQGIGVRGAARHEMGGKKKEEKN